MLQEEKKIYISKTWFFFQGIVLPTQDFKERARYLSNNFDFDAGEARKLWCFGPDGRGANLLIDGSKGLQNLNDIKDMVKAGFQWASQEVGILTSYTFNY